MLRRLRIFCRDQRGTLLTTEWVFVATILVLGACTYLAAHQCAAPGERPAGRRLLD